MTPRRVVVELAHHLAAASADPFGPMHMAATEGRAPMYAAVGSTSCGDLLHAVAFAAGCRSRAVNRREHQGWSPGVNLSRWFVPPFTPHARIWRPQRDEISPGDFLCYDYTTTKAHGCVFLGWGPDDTAITADLGQPGGRVYEAHVEVPRQSSRPLKFRGRDLSCSVPLSSIPFDAPAVDVPTWLRLRGLPVEPVTPAEYLAGQWRDL